MLTARAPATVVELLGILGAGGTYCPIDPTYPVARVNLAVLLINQGRLDEARPLLEKALRQSPKLPDGWNALGAILASRGDLAVAVKAWERAVAVGVA